MTQKAFPCLMINQVELGMLKKKTPYMQFALDARRARMFWRLDKATLLSYSKDLAHLLADNVGLSKTANLFCILLYLH